MERRNKMMIGIAAGAAITLAAVLAIGFAFQNSAESAAVDKSACMSDEQFASSKRFEATKPSWMPAGYSLQCQSSYPLRATMMYYPGPMSSSDPDVALRQDGAIIILVSDETLDGDNLNVPSPEQRLNDTTRLLTPELKEKMQFRYVTVNGNPGWAREAGDYGTFTTQYSNGTIISIEQTQMPARVQFYLEKTEYVLIAFRPADELIKMAESISIGG